MGLGFAFSYGAATWRDRLDDLWTIALLSGLFLGSAAVLAGWLLAPRLAANLSASGHEGMRIAMLPIPLMLATGYEAYLLLGTHRIAEFNAVRFVAPAFNLVSVLTVAAFGWIGVRSYAVAFLATQVASFGFCTLLLAMRLRPRFHLSVDLIPKLLSYGIKAQLSGLAAQTNLRLDQAVMSLFLIPEKLGQYVIAVSISGILGPFMNALATVILPRTAYASSNLIGAVAIAKHIRNAVLFSSPLLIVWSVLMPWIIPAFFGKGYAPAVIPAQVLVLAGLFQGLNIILGNGLRGLGRPGFPAVAEAAGMAVTVALLYALLPVLGILGAAVTSVFAYLTVTIVQFSLVARTAEMKAADLASSQLTHEALADSGRLLRAIVSH